MKKILFLLLLLFTVLIYGQTLQNPTFGIVTEKNNATDSTPAYFVTSQTDGVHKKTPAVLVAFKSDLPVSYAIIVYVNDISPLTATIFDDENPPTTNDNALKTDVDNLYIGTDASTWVYNGSAYVTKSVPASSNFKLVSGVDAGSNKTSSIYREGSISSDAFVSSNAGMFTNRNGSNTAQNGGFYAFSNAAASNIMMFQLNASNGLDLWNYASSTWNKRFTFSNAGDFSTVGNITGGLKVRKISTNTTLADSDNGTIILLTASCTVTLPNGLMNGFNCSFSTLAGATLTYSLGGSVVLLNNLGTTMAEKLSHTIVNTGISNEYLTAGSL